MKVMFWDRVPRRARLDQGDAFEHDQGLPSPPISHQQRWPEHKTPRHFSRDVCIKLYLDAMRSSTRFNTYRPGTKLEEVFGVFSKKLGLLGKSEARFWVRAVCDERAFVELKTVRPGEAACLEARRRLEEIDVDTPMTAEEVSERFDATFYGGERDQATRSRYSVDDFAPLALCLRAELGVVEGMGVLFESLSIYEYGHFFYHFGSTQGHEEEVIAVMREHVDASQCFLHRSPYTYVMANMLERCPDLDYLERAWELLSRVEWSFEGARGRLPMMWSEREDVFAWFDELKAPILPEQARALYVRFGEEGLDDLMKRVTMRYNQNGREALMRALLPVASAKMAPWMLALAQKEESRELARHWLHGEGVHATLGLMELVKSRGKRRNQAIMELRAIAEQGHSEEIRGLLDQVESPTARELIMHEVLEFEPEHVERATSQELPDWASCLLDDDEFPRGLDVNVVTEFFELDQAPVVTLLKTGHALPIELMTRVIALAQGAMSRAMKKGKKNSEKRRAREALEQVCRGHLAQIRQDVDAEQLGAWLWHVLEMWWSKKKPHSMASCLALVGYCASDREVIELMPRIKANRKWFATQDLKRHVCEVLDGFAMVGTATSWMLLDELATHGSSKWARAHASRKIDVLRREHGWSEAQWQDRIVSHAGLNEHGTRIFDYGGRRFELRFRGAFDVEFIDEQGDHFERLPPARKSDDVDMVRAARKDDKAVKAQLDQVIARQTLRFERAMIAMQTWPMEAWWEWVARHPLLHHFARKLVWVKQVDGEPDGYVVLTQEGSLIDVDYEEVECPDGAHMRLLHPAELDAEQRRGWVELMADFEIVQPFAQLEREAFGPGQSFEDVIEVLGARDWWRWGDAMDGDHGERYWKIRDHDGKLSAIWHVSGPWCMVIIRAPEGWGEEHQGDVPGPGAYACLGELPDPGSIVPWAQIPAPVYSEMYRATRKIVAEPLRKYV